MKKLLRQRWVLGALLLLAVVAGGYLVVPVQESRISKANCDRIQVAWNGQQVEELLGKPDGFVSSSQSGGSVMWTGEDGTQIPVILRTWPTDLYEDEDGNRILVNFDSKRRVIEKEFTPTSLLAFELLKRRIKRRMGLPDSRTIAPPPAATP